MTTTHTTAQPRIAVTGLGLVCPLGPSVTTAWPRIRDGASGIVPVTAFATSGLDVHNAGEITDFDPGHVLPPESQAACGRASQLAIVAAHEALTQAGLTTGSPYAPHRSGVSFGTTMGEPGVFDQIFDIIASGDGIAAVPSTLWQQLPGHNISHRLAAHFGLCGPNHLIPTACAAGNYAIGYAADLLRAGQADVMVVGGSDALSRMAFVGFHKLRAMAAERVTPFDRERKGMMIGEGAAVLILERLDDALARGASIQAEFLAYGLGCDAHKMTIPHPEGAGGIRALRLALRHAGLQPEQIDHISAHGTGTQENDRIETLIIKEVLGDHAYRCPINSIKAMLGHCMGASSAIEAVVACLSLQHGVLPPTLHLKHPDPACDLDYIPEGPRHQPIEIAASHAYAFGGNASAILLKRWSAPKQSSPDAPSPLSPETPLQAQKEPIAITRLAAISPLGIGAKALRAGLEKGTSALAPLQREGLSAPLSGGEVRDFAPEAILGRKGLRVLDRNTRLTLSCIQHDLSEAIDAIGPEKVGLALGTTFGSFTSMAEFARTYLIDGFRALNPRHFPNLVINAPPSQGNIRFGLTASSTTFANGTTAGLDALLFGAMRLQRGDEAAYICGASESLSTDLCEAGLQMGRWGQSDGLAPFAPDADGTLPGEGAAMVLIEPLAAAQARGATPLAVIEAAASCFGQPTPQPASSHDAAGPAKNTENNGLMCFSDRPTGPSADAAAHVIRSLLNDAQIAPGDLDFIAVSAHGDPAKDAAEKAGLEAALGEALAEIPLVAYAAYWGDADGASSALQLVAAVIDLQRDQLAATPAAPNAAATSPLALSPQPLSRPLRRCMVLSLGDSGGATAVLLAKETT